ncbi:MAG: transporter [Oscillospiraceae bacterium]|nr:transporter [Oscillospiraceae bacterium]
MRRTKSLYITLFIAVLLLSIFAVPALADAGNFSGGSSYGGSFGGSYGGSYGGSSGAWGLLALGGLGGGSGGIIAFIIIAFIIINIIRKLKSTGSQASSGAMGSSYTDYSELVPISTIKGADPNFSEAAMKEKIANLYVRMQNAWQEKEFDGMRPFMTDALYSQFKLQLDEIIRSECTNYIERIAVLDVALSGWRTDEAVDAIVAIVNTRIVDYTTNDKAGMLVSGSKSVEKFMTYEWTLIRSKGMTTPDHTGEGSEETATIHCPSCGAPVEINQSAKCPYCDSVISAGDYDWVISAIKGIAQRNG